MVGFDSSRCVVVSCKGFPYLFSKLLDKSCNKAFLHFANIWWKEGNSISKLIQARLQSGNIHEYIFLVFGHKASSHSDLRKFQVSLCGADLIAYGYHWRPKLFMSSDSPSLHTASSSWFLKDGGNCCPFVPLHPCFT